MKKFITGTALVATIGVGGTTVAGTAAFAHGDGHDGRRNGHDNDPNRLDRRHDNNVDFVSARSESHHNHRGWVLGRHWLIATAADAIKIEPSALREQLREGKSIAEVAAANGVNPDTVVNALMARLSQKVDRAVEMGKISAEKATMIKTSLRDRVTKFVNFKKTMPEQSATSSTTA